jgi:hypothetical protein
MIKTASVMTTLERSWIDANPELASQAVSAFYEKYSPFFKIVFNFKDPNRLKLIAFEDSELLEEAEMVNDYYNQF